MRFYAGAPVVSRSGHRLGMLCFADVKPRHLGPAGAATLNTLADLVAAELDRQAAHAAAARAAAALAVAPPALRGADRASEGALLVDARAVAAAFAADGSSGPGSGSSGSGVLPAPWPILHASAAAASSLGLPEAAVANGRDLWAYFERPRAGARGVAGAKAPASVGAAAAAGRFFVLRGVRAREGSGPGGVRLFDLAFWPSALGPPERAGRHPVGVPAAVASPATAAAAEADPGGGGIYCVTLALAFAAGSPREGAAGGGWPARLGRAPTPPLPGLELGVLLGRGSHGTVHCCVWGGETVAVKAREEREEGAGFAWAGARDPIDHLALPSHAHRSCQTTLSSRATPMAPPSKPPSAAACPRTQTWSASAPPPTPPRRPAPTIPRDRSKSTAPASRPRAGGGRRGSSSISPTAAPCATRPSAACSRQRRARPTMAAAPTRHPWPRPPRSPRSQPTSRPASPPCTPPAWRTGI
jgi:hypothetical protein